MNPWSPKGLVQSNGSPLITKNKPATKQPVNKVKDMVGKMGLKQANGSALITKGPSRMRLNQLKRRANLNK